MRPFDAPLQPVSGESGCLEVDDPVPVRRVQSVPLPHPPPLLQVALVAAQHHVRVVVEGVGAKLGQPVGHVQEAGGEEKSSIVTCQVATAS